MALWGPLHASPVLAGNNHALLVGAATYPALDERYWLKGTTNDVALVHDYLVNAAPIPFTPQDITLLGETDNADGPATLARIRAAFDALETSVAPGDFVYLHFAGHGTQAPARDPATEIDGLDELFLPVDIGPWANAAGKVENALVDDEIGQRIAALRARGANVWAVFDSCHSGTVTRSAPSGEDKVVMRKLGPDVLGIPGNTLPVTPEDTALDIAGAPTTRALPGNAQEKGAFVAFYAAQTNEPTPEMNMPPGKTGRKPHGVFTFTLFQSLAANGNMTYEQLGQEVLRRYAVSRLARSTPYFEGDLDRPVFGRGDAGRLAQWPLTPDYETGTVSIPAGTLFGLNEGDRLAIMASPADPGTAALGHARITRASALEANAAPIATETRDALALGDIPRGAYLRKLETGLDFQLQIALPELNGPATQAAHAATRALAANGTLGPRITFVDPGAPADLRLAIAPQSPRPDAVWVLPASGLFDPQAPSISTADKDTGALTSAMGDTLSKMARALNVMRMGDAFGAASLDVEVTLQTRNPNEAGKTELTPISTAKVPRMIPGDELHIMALNNMGQAVDLNALYIDANYSISHMWKGRMQPGDRLDKGLVGITDSAFGRERLVVVVSPAARGTLIQDLSFLEQDSVITTREQNAGTPANLSDIASALDVAAFGTTMRGGSSLTQDDSPKASVRQFELNVAPTR
ncbi:caspase family protein [Roseovarius sp. MMSF_3281]|uniref:caspase family protein n=1 Tax=Roseovarius sp. MMSF_3281 TaxID=3046694 RepID=UPI00273E7181|nr:caspase family protein [Roseovarius sp. MMSF_3281]